MEAVKPSWIISNAMSALHLALEALEAPRAKAQNPAQLLDEYLPPVNPFPLPLSSPWKSTLLPSAEHSNIEVM